VGVVWVYFISTEVVSNIRALGVAFNLSEPTIGESSFTPSEFLCNVVCRCILFRQE
jgi:hypothetical protein